MSRPLLVLAAVLLLAPGCGRLVAPPDATPKQFRDRQILVTLAAGDDTLPQRLAAELQQTFDLRPGGAFPLRSLEVHCLVFEVDPGWAIEPLLARLNDDPRVVLAQRNQVFFGLQAAPHSEPYAGLQYGASLINVPAAHRYSTGLGVTVAVIDTGAARGHPDLNPRIVGYANFVEHGEPSFDSDRHGTAVAGVIAAPADNRTGIFGVAPQARLLIGKACWYPHPAAGRAQCSSWTLARALDYAIEAGARVINLSLAGPPDRLVTQLLASAAERRITVVAATAARDAAGPGFPAVLDGVIAVLTGDRERIPTPNWQASKPLLAAPGVEILSAAPPAGYDFFTGSSLAAAHVSGVAALLLAHRPALTPAELQRLLLISARPHPGGSRRSEIKMVDACAALARLDTGVRCSTADQGKSS